MHPLMEEGNLVFMAFFLVVYLFSDSGFVLKFEMFSVLTRDLVKILMLFSHEFLCLYFGSFRN